MPADSTIPHSPHSPLSRKVIRSLMAAAGESKHSLQEALSQLAAVGDPAIDEAVAYFKPTLDALAGRMSELHFLATTDELTGLLNRRAFYEQVDAILREQGDIEDFRAAVLVYDIDDLKRHNDEFGHASGDAILRETASLIRETCRTHDRVARMGGDEFAVLFWGLPREPNSQPLQGIETLTERLLAALRERNFSSLGPNAPGALTISGGLAQFPQHGLSCQALLTCADRALYQAKQAGKNSIRFVGAEG